MPGLVDEFQDESEVGLAVPAPDRALRWFAIAVTTLAARGPVLFSVVKGGATGSSYSVDVARMIANPCQHCRASCVNARMMHKWRLIGKAVSIRA